MTPAAATSQTLAPGADAYVNADVPSANHGTITSLRVDASPDTRSYLRFTISGLAGPPAKATLRVYANSSQSVGYDALGVADNSWSETGITYSNAPALGAKLNAS